MIRLGLSQCVKLIKVQSKPLSHVVTLQQALQIEAATPVLQSIRTSSFFNRLPAENLWKSLTTVSNPGKKKGRGKGLDKRSSTNLNKGQFLGHGKANIYWPALSGPVVKGSEVFSQKQLKRDPHFEENILKLRQQLGRKKKVKIHPLERGWSGTYLKGKKLGPPDPIGDEKFEDFESVLLHTHYSSYMTNDMGRQKKIFIHIAVGNKNGLIGVARLKAKFLKNAVTRGKNRALQRLMEIKRCNNRTIYHDFCGQFARTKVFVTKKQEGYGLCCHRVIKAMCELIGVTDLHAKVEGSRNVDAVIKAFLTGLVQQRTFQELADERKLHVVEFRKERNYYPEVLGLCENPLSPEEARKDPHEFQQYIYRNQVRLRKERPRIRMANSNNFLTFLKRNDYKRNQNKIKVLLKAEYGGIKSHLTALYPECVSKYVAKRIRAKAKAVSS